MFRMRQFSYEVVSHASSRGRRSSLFLSEQISGGWSLYRTLPNIALEKHFKLN